MTHSPVQVSRVWGGVEEVQPPRAMAAAVTTTRAKSWSLLIIGIPPLFGLDEHGGGDRGIEWNRDGRSGHNRVNPFVRVGITAPATVGPVAGVSV